MLTLYLFRHGETEENSSGILQGHLPGKLSPRGHAQAAALAERLKQASISAIYSSDLARTRDTVRYLSREVALDVVFDAKIRERHLGVYEGEHGRRYYEDFKVSGLPRDLFRPEGGETIREVQARTDEFLESLLEQELEGGVAICTHGGVLVTLLASLADTSLEEMLQHRFQNTSLTIVEMSSREEIRIGCFNCSNHLLNLSLD